MGDQAAILEIAGIAARELTLFAAIGFAIGGIDELLVDLIWIVRALWRRAAVYTRHVRADAETLPAARTSGPIAVLVPAWREAHVIGPMLSHACTAFAGRHFRILVGCYPNDPETIGAARRAARDWPQVSVHVGLVPGPTTKADCLNMLWRAMLVEEHEQGPFKAVVLHDAEDVVHSAEIALFDRLIERFDLVQLPVVPLVDPASRWVGGIYCDEFAEAHGKTLVVREAVGAAIPSAGVGCALSRAALERIAERHGGQPFDAASLTEDYELGLRIAELGGRAAFVRLPARGRGMVAVRAHFPGTLDAAVRQKARWVTGIALAGWDRLGWRGDAAEIWMRLRDRRAPLAALVLCAAYAALLLGGVLWLFDASIVVGPVLGALLGFNAFLLVWRLAMRCAFVTRVYGWREGLCAIPRAIPANIVAIMAARRAMMGYWAMRRDGVVRWDKTDHAFPAAVPAE